MKNLISQVKSLPLILSVMGGDWRVLTWQVMWFVLCIKDHREYATEEKEYSTC